ncbi:uncharacterized protein LOC124143598 [Haliotis rufescens]|uniref:uncharacterized protein LOC124143598 n=1 Tax=Haliotis rufescens TaxID=6454 RepID=UPI001EB04F68|nr:uncharacterized protein LOC124143598 [Haliotis rufescens]
MSLVTMKVALLIVLFGCWRRVSTECVLPDLEIHEDNMMDLLLDLVLLNGEDHRMDNGVTLSCQHGILRANFRDAEPLVVDKQCLAVYVTKQESESILSCNIPLETDEWAVAPNELIPSEPEVEKIE